VIRVGLFDVGETLIDSASRQPFPGVAEALDVISEFTTADGRPLFLAIVSDFYLPRPRTEASMAAMEARYRDEVLGPGGLAKFFQPFDSHVTLSSRSGYSKPDKRIFDLAVARSGTGVTLDDCFFVTENADHLDKCQDYGIQPVRFGPVVEDMPGFEDWADAPAVIGGLIAPGSARSPMSAAVPQLFKRGLSDFRQTGRQGRRVRGEANQLVQLDDPRLGPLNGVYVALPTQVTVELASSGRVTEVASAGPGSDEVADAVNFVCSLMKSRSIAGEGLTTGPRATHAIEQDQAGRKRLVRRGYSKR